MYLFFRFRSLACLLFGLNLGEMCYSVAPWGLDFYGVVERRGGSSVLYALLVRFHHSLGPFERVW